MKNSYLTKALSGVQIVLGCVLFFVGVLKFAALGEFYATVSLLPFVPSQYAPFIAFLAIFAEVLLGALFLFNIRLNAVKIFVVALTFAYLLVVGWNFLTGAHFMCDDSPTNPISDRTRYACQTH